MHVTIELIELQTYAISKGESIIDKNGTYKSTSEVLNMFNKIWKNADNNEQEYIEKLLSKTPYIKQ